MKRFLFLVCLIGSQFLFSENGVIWQQVSGSWKIDKIGEESFLYDIRTNGYKFNYSELINNNSIRTLASFKYDRISLKLNAYNPVAQSAFAIFFDSPGDYREFSAFRFSGSKTEITKIEFITSRVKDTTLPRDRKLNFEIKTLEEKAISLPYSANHIIEISFKKNRIILSINEKEIMSVENSNRPEASQLGLYHTGNLLKVYYYEVFDGRKPVVLDNFSTDTIRRSTIKATVEKKQQ